MPDSNQPVIYDNPDDAPIDTTQMPIASEFDYYSNPAGVV
jgi:hypothetical protein